MDDKEELEFKIFGIYLFVNSILSILITGATIFLFFRENDIYEQVIAFLGIFFILFIWLTIINDFIYEKISSLYLKKIEKNQHSRNNK